MFRRAIDLDPGFARAHGALAYVKLQSLIMSDPDERETLLEDALRDGRKAVSLDDQDCMNHCVVGRILCFRHEYDEAVAYLEHCIRINPSFAQGYFALGFTFIVSGRAADAIPISSALSSSVRAIRTCRRVMPSGRWRISRSESWRLPRASRGGPRAFRTPITGRSWFSLHCSV